MKWLCYVATPYDCLIIQLYEGTATPPTITTELVFCYSTHNSLIYCLGNYSSEHRSDTQNKEANPRLLGLNVFVDTTTSFIRHFSIINSDSPPWQPATSEKPTANQSHRMNDRPLNFA